MPSCGTHPRSRELAVVTPKSEGGPRGGATRLLKAETEAGNGCYFRTVTVGPYSKHIDVLTALITYLALTPKKSRTVQGVAGDLGIEADRVQEAFDSFPAVFRMKQNRNGTSFYTLHARYALRPYDAAEDTDLPPVRPELLAVLLSFVTQRARDEFEFDRFAQEIRAAEKSAEGARRSADRAAVVALVGAIFAVLGAVLAAWIGGS